MTKRRLLLIVVPIAGLFGLLAFAIFAWRPSISPVASPDVSIDAALVKKGRMVVALGDCAVCHTRPGGQDFAGGLPLKTPFGIIFTTNITPDRETGIGGWPLAAFRRAMREGVSRDGHLLYPAFPYIHYTEVTDADIEAAYAFLMTRTPVHERAPENELPLPLRFRPSLAFWNLLYLRSGARPPKDDSEVERGRYLVDSLGHCSSCHTPLGIIGGEKSRQHFGGGRIDGWDAPALTELGNADIPWTRDQIVAYLSHGVAIEHGAAGGPMRPVVENLGTVPPADVQAIATYLMSLPQSPGTERVATVTIDPARLAHGQAVFQASCETCHGASASMTTALHRPSLALSSAFHGAAPRNAIATIIEGLSWPENPGVTTYMPSFGDALTDRDIADVVDYVRSTTGRAAWADTPATVTSLRKELKP
jgi:mono/diheme cytochrome c family protein